MTQTLRSRRRPLVLGEAPELVLESGAPPCDALERAALIAHWSKSPKVARSMATLVHELRNCGYEVYVVSAAECREALRWPTGYAHPSAIYRRPNIGYDFGSWAAGLKALPAIARAPHALLINDSMLGPFASIDSIVADFESSEARVWGLVSSSQEGYHLQSHFVGYQRGCLAREPLSSFWRSIRVEREKRDIIKNYELGLGRVIQGSGLPVRACYPWDSVVGEGDNPTIQGWRRLIALGFPFVKREILLRPASVMTDADQVQDVVRRAFGEDIRKWL